MPKDEGAEAGGSSGRLIEISVPVSTDAEYIPSLRALFEYHGGGAAVETLLRGPEDGEAYAEPVTWVRTWIPEEDAEARALVEEGLWRLNREHGMPAAIVRPLAKANWAEAWKAHYAPMQVGPFWVTPAWHDPAEAPEGAHVIRLDPGMAFGTGQHPTTRLCLACLPDEIGPATRVLDVGTGSGVLAIAAARVGAAEVVGIDIDPAAISAAQSNAELNGVNIEMLAGSQDALAESRDPDTAGPGSGPGPGPSPRLHGFDLVLANLLAHTLHALAEDLWSWTADGGVLIGSGILVEQVEDVIESLERAGFRRRRVAIDGDWAAIIADRPG